MYRAFRWTASVAAASLIAAPGSTQQPAPILGPVLVQPSSIASSGNVLVYEYRIVNPSSSRAGVGTFLIDVSAPPGTGHATLPSTGPFRHLASEQGAASPADHVPLGALSPVRWRANLTVQGEVKWFGIAGSAVDLDSIAPGEAVAGFGVRSTYLPGVRAFAAQPTWQSCCAEPLPPSPDREEGEHPDKTEFQVVGRTIGPVYSPASASVGLLSSLLAQSCGELGWIVHRGICQSLGVKLSGAGRSLAAGQRSAAAGQLRSFLHELDAQHGSQPGKHVGDLPYWLLRSHAEHLLAALPQS